VRRPTLPTGPLRERNFRRYFTGQALSQFGDALVPVALAFAVLDLSASAGAIGLVLLANRLPMVVLVLVGGVVGDRWPRQRVMLVTDAVRCACQAVTAALLISGSAQLWQLVVLQAVVGAGGAFFVPAASGLLPATVSSGRLQQANALVGLSRNTTALVAAGISAALVATVGSGWAVAIDAVTFMASGVSLALLRTAPMAARTSPVSMPRQLVEGWRIVAERRWLWASILHISLVNALAIAPFLVLGPLVAHRELGGAPAWAAIGTSYAAGAIAGGLVSLRVAPRHPLRWSVLAVLALCPLMALLAAPGPLWALMAAATAAGAQASFSTAVNAVTTQRHISADALSRVSSYSQLGVLVLVPASFAVTGTVADRIGANTTLWLCAGSVAVATVATLAIRDVRDLPHAPAEERQPAHAA
jgi:MFS family permease